MNAENKSWNDDVLDRKQYADILTTNLAEQAKISASSSNSGLTVALDGDWGAGKTFFIRKWALDLEEKGFTTIIFDAWENDIGDETSVSLMSTIRHTIHEKLSSQKVKEGVAEQAKEQLIKTVRILRKAILPTTKMIAKSLIKKATGVAVNEIFDYINNDNNEKQEPDNGKLENTLDEIFNQSLDEHAAKKNAIREFKSNLSLVITKLEKSINSKLPVFIFVDEVDRCRPTYAIKLLEEIKHLFGVPNTCFVVSTNFSQLTESIRAVYGHNFDGKRYLKRFFDRQYTLPEPDNHSFSIQLLKQECPISKRSIVTGLPSTPYKYTNIDCISLMVDATNLDLRSQKQIFALANDVAANIPEGGDLYLLWLYFLCVIFHKDQSLLDKISDPISDHKTFLNICNEIIHTRTLIKSNAPGEGFNGIKKFHETELKDILWEYKKLSHTDLKTIRHDSQSVNIYNYPKSIIHQLAREMPSKYYETETYQPSIQRYVKLVKASGVLIWSETEQGDG